ncbi:hypothetical protein NVP1244A_051 [Vibrio phage 1.244.A._10N.261.54.C3]|nr:hypothetical protein NVP1244A_051 [Vibrio phage 1.244.A._10N.261.54.C3]AUR98679.1 hypothetical protein NVP1255O_051 [Vibrio phage 1.255.O._10N.286.45.F1]
MRLTDSNSKGKIITQNRSGSYTAYEHDELDEAICVLIEAKRIRDNNLPRVFIDSRQKKNY